MAQFPVPRRTVASRQLHVVVTCSDRKAVPPDDDLKLRNYRTGSLAARAQRWLGALSSVDSQSVPAMDLYQGEHWSVVRDLYRAGRRCDLNVSLWVASAGYGLFPIDARLKSYAATFASGHADSVRRPDDLAARDVLPRWWGVLSESPGPQAGAPRSLHALATQDPAARIIVAASEAYLAAMAPDLKAASNRLRSTDQCLVVSSGANLVGSLNPLAVPVDARFQSLLGGARTSLNVRVVRWLLETADHHRFERASVVAAAATALAEQPPIVRYDRKPLSDDEVLAWIKAGLTELPGASATALLRAFRDAGFACEQRRFGGLHREAAMR